MSESTKRHASSWMVWIRIKMTLDGEGMMNAEVI